MLGLLLITATHDAQRTQGLDVKILPLSFPTSFFFPRFWLPSSTHSMLQLYLRSCPACAGWQAMLFSLILTAWAISWWISWALRRGQAQKDVHSAGRGHLLSKPNLLSQLAHLRVGLAYTTSKVYVLSCFPFSAHGVTLVGSHDPHCQSRLLLHFSPSFRSQLSLFLQKLYDASLPYPPNSYRHPCCSIIIFTWLVCHISLTLLGIQTTKY